MEIVFILVQPKVPGNVGATARAIKTMGFAELRIINSSAHLSKEAKILAHGSCEILEQARHFDNLEMATRDIDFIIGTTAKKRRTNHDIHSSIEIPAIIEQKSKSIHKLAMVFGREESGLTIEESKLCHIMTSIPMNQLYPSLNLSQAVMVYAYELSKLSFQNVPAMHKKKNTAQFNALTEKFDQIIAGTSFGQNMTKKKRVLERLSLLGDDDIQLLHGVCSDIIAKLPGQS